jgi:hypothetical protein
MQKILIDRGQFEFQRAIEMLDDLRIGLHAGAPQDGSARRRVPRVQPVHRSSRDANEPLRRVVSVAARLSAVGLSNFRRLFGRDEARGAIRPALMDDLGHVRQALAALRPAPAAAEHVRDAMGVAGGFMDRAVVQRIANAHNHDGPFHRRSVLKMVQMRMIVNSPPVGGSGGSARFQPFWRF